MRVPNTTQLIESARIHRGGITTTSPVTQQTIPTNTIASPENGTIAPYFIGFCARMTKNTPNAAHTADIRRAVYKNSGKSGIDSTPKNLVKDTHVETGRKNITNTVSRHPIPAIHKQVFNPLVVLRIAFPFKIISRLL
jgi:hypothetical protein